MNLRFFFLLVCLALPAAAEPYAGQLSDSWRTRIANLAKPQTLSATFKESRQTPVKKRPVIVTGTVRIDRARGLSLAYDQSRAPIVILDEHGLLLRHPDGREQTAPPEAGNDLRLLHALFAFDLATLEQSYAIAPIESSDRTWTLSFTRRPDSPASYRELTLTGDDTRLLTITLAKTPNNRTEITLDPPQLDPAFTPDELARYFR
jgi:hypothetical protein